MDYKEFANFLAKLKQIKISNARFAKYIGYDATTICNFAAGKKPIPKIIDLVIGGLKFKEQLGIDLKNIIK